ncbi:restriction endonuclease [Methanococcoides sp. SA1]|nr:restriction endonuclease [Methanococcoides sp. SA1]
MNGYDFEKFVGKIYSKNGYHVKQTSLSGDQGADLIITKNGDRTSIQTKRSASKISNSAIQEVVASKAYYDCNDCMVVTNNYFTKSAIDLARVNNVKLIDRDNLKRLIRTTSVSESDSQVNTSKSSIYTPVDNTISSSNIVAWDDAIEKQDVELLCPTCKKKSAYNVDIKKLTSGQSIEARCQNCGMPVTLSL